MRLYEHSRSTFSVSEINQWNRTGQGWWVREDFQIIRRGKKDDFDDWYGPFTEGEARAKAAAWNEEAKR